MIVAWINIILLAASARICVAWPKRKGKALLVAATTLLLTNLLTFQFLALLPSRTVDRYPTLWYRIDVMATLAGMTAYALFLAYVIVAEKAVVSGVLQQDAKTCAVGIRRSGVLSMQGRYNRARLFWTMLVLFLCAYLSETFIAAPLIRAVDAEGDPISILIIGLPILAYLVIGAFQIVKRLHDMNRPGSHYWFLLIPIYGFFFAIVLQFCPGTKGANKYGEDPLQAGQPVPEDPAAVVAPPSILRDPPPPPPSINNVKDFKFPCPHCGQRLEAPAEMFGTVINCPSCSTRIQVPQSA